MLKDGDTVTISSTRKLLQADLSEDMIARRKRAWKPKKIAYTHGALYKYARLVSSASRGAVTS
ncbi:MAG TPA: hypothetical protein ENN69_00020 [Spirochaetia bacterium]|nr:hypothetical protein [Spirochaetia bacterium]